jgi:hypothetical protein
MELLAASSSYGKGSAWKQKESEQVGGIYEFLELQSQ